MTKLVWDEVGGRQYETGIDRGVLYYGSASPWNGLVSVAETRTREVKPFYIEGMKFLDVEVLDAYSAKLQAFTYPSILDDLTGHADAGYGVFLHDQRARLFSLSYRTKIGNDLDADAGYKIHVIYSVIAIPSDHTFQTTDDTPDLDPFEWDLTARAQLVAGYRPASHISIDSRRVDPGDLAAIEARLYGTDTDDPDLPNLVDLLTMNF